MVAGTLLAVMLLYLGDYLVARRRGTGGVRTVQVQPYYAVPLKDGKTEFMMLDPKNRTCVRAIFPHFGAPPCWYLEHHTQQRINM